MRKTRFLLIIAGLVPIITACSGKENYGLCIISTEGKAGINAGSFFPMHSVVKFPQALYVADYLQRNDIPLDSAVVVRKSELMQDTWSPMLEGMDESRTFSFRELLRLSLAESDNNACDLLFKLCGMPEAVDSFVKGLGFNDINIAVTERQMHDDIALLPPIAVLHRKWHVCSCGSRSIKMTMHIIGRFGTRCPPAILVQTGFLQPSGPIVKLSIRPVPAFLRKKDFRN